MLTRCAITLHQSLVQGGTNMFNKVKATGMALAAYAILLSVLTSWVHVKVGEQHGE